MGRRKRKEVGRRRDGVNVTMATMIVREEGNWMVIGLLKHTSGCEINSRILMHVSFLFTHTIQQRTHAQ